jgi:hypothetical protein
MYRGHRAYPSPGTIPGALGKYPKQQAVQAYWSGGVRVVAARGIPVLAVLAGVLLSACGLSFGSNSGGPAWESGYKAGNAARAHHLFRHGATRYHITAFCVEAAFADIRTMKTAVLQWTEGFEKGCMRTLPPRRRACAVVSQSAAACRPAGRGLRYRPG